MKGKKGVLSFPALTTPAEASSLEPDSALQAQFIAFIEATPDGIALITPQGGLRYINPAGRIMLGLKPAQRLASLSIFDFCSPKLDALIRHEALPAALHEGRWSAETELLDSAGHTFPAFVILFANKEAQTEVLLLSLILRDISEQKRREAELVHLAHHDPLTGLFNRRRFQEELESRLAHVRRYGTQGALLLIDVDGLKTINDTFGHQAGDAVLRDLAALLQTQLREVDIIARLGGDEFAVLISAHETQHVLTVAERLVQVVHRHVTVVAGHHLHSTISIGIAVIPQHGSTADQVFEHADLALYQAKTAGRNQFRLFSAKTKQ